MSLPHASSVHLCVRRRVSAAQFMPCHLLEHTSKTGVAKVCLGNVPFTLIEDQWGANGRPHLSGIRIRGCWEIIARVKCAVGFYVQ